MTVLMFLRDFLLFCFVWINFGYCQDFGYDGSEGPTHWGDKYAKCIGKHQSPIDIEAKNVIKTTFPPLVFEKFDTPLEVVSLENNGHTVMIKVKKGAVPTLHGGPLQGVYRFAQLHFHWGPNDTLGSENQINHHSFPLELHMVMYNTKHKDFKDALNFEDGLTVLSFLYSVSHQDNNVYDQFEQGLRTVRDMSASTDISNFVSLNDFTTFDRTAYFTYEGSLTTPPCSEVVIWIEFINTIPLSKAQIKAFRSLSSKTGHLTHNYRPIQPIHDRIIYMNGANIFNGSIFNIALTIFLVAFKDRFS